MDHIIGVVINGLIRPMIDYQRHQVLINMVYNSAFILDSYLNIPYGLAPEHTIEATIIAPPSNEIVPPFSPLSSPLSSRPPSPPPSIPPGHHYHHE